MDQTIVSPSLSPHPLPSPRRQLASLLLHWISWSWPHNPSSFLLGPDATWAILQNEILASIFRTFPEAIQRKYLIMHNKQKDPIMLSWCSAALWFRVISLTVKETGTEMFSLLPRDCLSGEGKTTHRHHITISYVFLGRWRKVMWIIHM